MSGYSLHALGWKPWAAHLQGLQLQGLRQPAARWFWCDLDGAHLSPSPPTQLRATSHIWGWTAGAWWRFRCDRTDAAGAQLTTSGSGQPCRVIETPSTTWAAGDGRTALTEGLRGRAVILRQTVDPVLLDFIEVT